jgi:hypothetical protein
MTEGIAVEGMAAESKKTVHQREKALCTWFTGQELAEFM